MSTWKACSQEFDSPTYKVRDLVTCEKSSSDEVIWYHLISILGLNSGSLRVQLCGSIYMRLKYAFRDRIPLRWIPRIAYLLYILSIR